MCSNLLCCYNINFKDFIKLSKESASRAFHQTEECKLLCANSQKAQQDLKINFNSEDYSYIEDIAKRQESSIFI